MTIGDLLSNWRDQAAQYERDGVTVGARILSRCAAELEEIARDLESRAMTIREASEISGYSADHIGRMIRNGQVENVGTKYRPRVHGTDVDRLKQRNARKAAALPPSAPARYDPTADARSLVRRRNGGTDAA